MYEPHAVTIFIMLCFFLIVGGGVLTESLAVMVAVVPDSF